MRRTRQLLAAGVVAVSVCVAGCSATDHAPEPSPAATSRFVDPTRPVAVDGTGVSIEESASGGDAHEEPAVGEQQAAVTAATRVVDAWLTPDQETRRTLFQGVAARALVDAFDDPRFTPGAGGPVGPVHVLVTEPMLIVTRHRLDTGAAVDVTLIPEPTATHGWIAIAINAA